MIALATNLVAFVPPGRPLRCSQRAPVVSVGVEMEDANLVVPPAPLIIVGPGCLNTQLLTGKLAAAAGHRVQCVTRAADVSSANRLMYGDAEPPTFRPLFSCANTQIGAALSAAEGMILCVTG
eukprot:CAMPEP_0119078460 /NCGR_PEP_ID=MMETSP1178-20130426/101017_1 /TAXON_ID=33656 /ORGANISM="unid sp, Strain CCMP2000" /LENGTH=122 /DNA_ID=CAMNT_0007060909 /DNA_START=30 /DNA_END=394 /DNA_ORIENTATION=+